MHILGFFSKGKSTPSNLFVSQLDYSELCDNDVRLPEEKQYYLTLDQATKATGIALVSTDLECILLLTIVSNFSKAIDKSKFFDALSEFIRALIYGLNIKAVAFEEVPPTEYSHTRRVLEEWKGALSRDLYTFPELAHLEQSYRFSVLPNVWKSAIRDKSAGVNRTDNKVEMAKDMCKLVPRLSCYLDELHTYSGHSYDGFDAFGLSYYLITKCFSGDDIINNGLVAETGSFSVIYAYASPDTMKLAQEYFTMILGAAATVRLWQSDKTIFENFRMAANSGMAVLMKVESTQLLVSYLIEFADTYVEGFVLWVLIGSTRRHLKKDMCSKLESFGFKSRIYQ